MTRTLVGAAEPPERQPTPNAATWTGNTTCGDWRYSTPSVTYGSNVRAWWAVATTR